MNFFLLDATAGNGILTKATVPIYATGVLTCYNQVRVLSLSLAFLNSFIVSVKNAGLNLIFVERLF